MIPLFLLRFYQMAHNYNLCVVSKRNTFKVGLM